MGTHRSPDEWRSLFDKQLHSGLNKTQFCRQHGITRSAFSNARHRLSDTPTPFVQAIPPNLDADKSVSPATLPANAPALCTSEALVAQPARQLTLSLPGATLSLPSDISPRWLATLLREVAP
ncbi:MAG: IS66 family insertion sequence element accessory protein TnpA [Plesiomonas shigelloides]